MLIATDNELVRTDTGHDEHIEKRTHLQPESSCDSSDPLNFSLWRKTAILLLMSLYAFISTGSSAILGSTYPVLTTAFATFDRSGQSTGIVPFSDLTQLTAVNNVMLGAANIWWVPLGNVYGRRPIILVNLALLAGFSFWCGKAETFHSLIVARVLQGIGGAAADTLAPDVVGRVFFLHQRGRAMAIYTIFFGFGLTCRRLGRRLRHVFLVMALDNVPSRHSLSDPVYHDVLAYAQNTLRSYASTRACR